MGAGQSPEAALRVMDEHFIETAIVSLSTPGVGPTPDTSLEEARHRARDVNECAAEHARNHPGAIESRAKAVQGGYGAQTLLGGQRRGAV